MKLSLTNVVCSVIIALSSSYAPAQAGGGGLLAYPKAKTVEQVDDYHGVKVADPYRWLEDTDSADTHAWVEEENKLTFGYLEQIPYRKAIRDRMTKLWNFERFTVPQQQGGRYFYQHNNGLQNQNVLLVARVAERGAAAVARSEYVVVGWDGRARGLRRLPMTASSWRTGRRLRDRIGRSGTCATSIRARTFLI